MQTGPEELFPVESKNPTNNINIFSKFSVDISA
jgi:hypothetical protein